MTKTSKMLLGLAGAVIAAAAYAAVSCPIDNGGMYFTGSTKTVGGKLLKEYKCPQGHTTWVVD